MRFHVLLAVSALALALLAALAVQLRKGGAHYLVLGSALLFLLIAGIAWVQWLATGRAW